MSDERRELIEHAKRRDPALARLIEAGDREAQDKSAKYRAVIERLRAKNPTFADLLEKAQSVYDNVRQFIIGQNHMVSYVGIGLFGRNPQNPRSEEEGAEMSAKEYAGICAHGNILGDPGTGKTVTGETYAFSFNGTYNRIQGRSDLEPSDIIGQQQQYRDEHDKLCEDFCEGPIFSNILLSDEINRNTQRTQAALLQAMAEGKVERDILRKGSRPVKRKVLLPRPFYVLSTQNPIEQEGVNELPEAQLDRFAMQLVTDGMTTDQIMDIIDLIEQVYGKKPVKAVISPGDVLDIQQFIADNVVVSRPVKRYIARLAKAVLPYNDLPNGVEEKDEKFLAAVRSLHRDPLVIGKKSYRLAELVEGAMYNRMAIVMNSLAKVQAFMQGRLYVLPEDVQKVSLPVSRHRIALHVRAESVLQTTPRTPEERRLDHARLADIILLHVYQKIPIPLQDSL